MLNEDGLTRPLKDHEMALGIGLFCERRVFDSQQR